LKHQKKKRSVVWGDIGGPGKAGWGRGVGCNENLGVCDRTVLTKTISVTEKAVVRKGRAGTRQTTAELKRGELGKESKDRGRTSLKSNQEKGPEEGRGKGRGVVLQVVK